MPLCFGEAPPLALLFLLGLWPPCSRQSVPPSRRLAISLLCPHVNVLREIFLLLFYNKIRNHKYIYIWIYTTRPASRECSCVSFPYRDSTPRVDRSGQRNPMSPRNREATSPTHNVYESQGEGAEYSETSCPKTLCPFSCPGSSLQERGRGLSLLGTPLPPPAEQCPHLPLSSPGNGGRK